MRGSASRAGRAASPAARRPPDGAAARVGTSACSASWLCGPGDRAGVDGAVVRNGTRAARRRSGRRASRSSSRPVPVTSPITVASTSHRSQTPRNAAQLARLDDRTHALLRLAHQDLLGASVGVAQRDGGPAGRACRPSPLRPARWWRTRCPHRRGPGCPLTRPCAVELLAGSISNFSGTGHRPARWAAWPRTAVAEPAERRAGQDRHAADAVGPVLRAEQDDLVAGPVGGASLRSPCRITPTHSALTSGFPA